MTLSAMDKLLIEILDRQNEDGRGAELHEEKVRAVLCEGQSFNDHEKWLLATSPLARKIYAEVWEEVEINREASRRRWERAGLRTTADITMLAASGDPYPLDIPSDDFSVTIRPHPNGEGWTVMLALKDTFRKSVTVDDVLALIDERGVIWMRGKPNVYGQIHAYRWPCDQSPVERIQQPGFELRLQPA